MPTRRTRRGYEGYHKRTGVSAAELDEALAHVRAMARREGVRIALAGGLAMRYYGSPRVTEDVDVIAERKLRSMPSGRPLTFGGVQSHAPNGVAVDVILRDDKYEKLYGHALANAVGGIVRPEHLTSMKLQAARARDEGDLDYLLVTMNEVTFQRAKRIAERFLGPYAGDELVSRREEAKWRKRTGKL